MTRDRGVVLINALVIVLAISAVAAALLARSEAARIRAQGAQSGEQLELYLDAAERLVPDLLGPEREAGLTHPGQAWATAGMRFPIDRGGVALDITDLQGRLNVNWLMHGGDYVDDVFASVFNELGVPLSLLHEIEEFVSHAGPAGAGRYLARRPAVLPRGGPARVLQDLRAVDGMTPRYFALLEPVLAALAVDTRLNLNTAPEIVKKAAIAPLPAEMIPEILQRDTPIRSISELRNRAIEILQTEEIEHLPFERLTVASRWFQADLLARLEDASQRRRVLFFVDISPEMPVQRVMGWAVYD